MLISDRLSGLYNLMYGASFTWNSVSSLSRRMTALAAITEMRIAIVQLEELNKKLEIELSIEDADINFKPWFDGDSNDNIQCFFDSSSHIEDEDTGSTINMIPDLFPIGKSTSFNEKSPEVLKT